MTITTAQIDAAIECCDQVDEACTSSMDPGAALRAVRSSIEQLMNTVKVDDARRERHKRIVQERNRETALPTGAIDARDWDNGNDTNDDPGPAHLDEREVFYAHIVIEGCGEMATFSRNQNADGTLEPLEIRIEEFSEVTPDEAHQFARELFAALDRIAPSRKVVQNSRGLHTAPSKRY